MRWLVRLGPVVLILAAAFVLRLWGTRYCLPYGFAHPDEEIIIRDAMTMGASKTLHPTFFDYPALFTYLILLVVSAKYALWHLLGACKSPVDLAFEYALTPGSIHLLVRMISVAAGTLTVAVTYLLGKRAANAAVGAAAAAMMAFSLEHVTQSHWAIPEATMVLFFTVSLYFACRLVTSGTIWSYAAAGLSAGLASATKYNAVSILPVLVIAHLLRARAGKSRLVDGRLVLGAFCVAVGFFAGCPYWLIDPQPYYSALRWTQSHIGVGHLGVTEGPRWLWVLSFLLTEEKGIGALMLIGWVHALVRRRDDLLLLISAGFTFLLVGGSAKTALYLFLPAYPPLCILGAESLEILTRRVLRVKRVMLWLPASAVLLAVPQIAQISATDSRMTATDTRIIARDWIERNIPSMTTIAMDEPRGYCAPVIADNFVPAWSRRCPAIKSRLEAAVRGRPKYRIIGLRSEKQTSEKNRPSDYAAWAAERHWLALHELRRQGVGYIVVSSYCYERYWESRPPPVGSPLREVFLDNGVHYARMMSSPELTLVRSFAPSKRNLGPTVRVYRFTATPAQRTRIGAGGSS